jgi:hypothetical protein
MINDLLFLSASQPTSDTRTSAIESESTLLDAVSKEDDQVLRDTLFGLIASFLELSPTSPPDFGAEPTSGDHSPFESANPLHIYSWNWVFRLFAHRYIKNDVPLISRYGAGISSL